MSGPAPAAENPPAAFVYLMRCADGSLYGGWTTDVARRARAHMAGRGARYTRARHAVALAYAELCPDKSAALRREAALKALPKAGKEALAARWRADTSARLRRAAAGDVPAVAALLGWCAAHDRGGARLAEAAGGWLAALAGSESAGPALPGLVAAGPGGRMLGVCWAAPAPGGAAEVWAVCAPCARGIGLGGRLTAALAEVLRAQEYSVKPAAARGFGGGAAGLARRFASV